MTVGEERLQEQTRPSQTAPGVEGQPSVDIVIDNFNYGRFLGAAIDSALGQSYEQTRVIVVDDGSTDDSREVIAAYGDRIEPVLKENGGQASAFNAGLARVRGDVVIFLDADDLLLPEAVREIASMFRDRPELAKVHYRMAVVDVDGSPTGGFRPSTYLRLPAGDLRVATARFPFDIARPPTSGNAFATRVLRAIAPIRDCGEGDGADWYVVHLAGLFGPVGAIDAPLALYRVHGSNRYEIDSLSLDLEHVRATLERTTRAQRFIQEAAARVGLDCSRDDVSMCVIADRAISTKLDPARHPIPGDTPLKLIALGRRAAARRFDVRFPMKAMFVVWLVCLAVAPRPIARWLAEVFSYPDRRKGINRWLARMHRRG